MSTTEHKLERIKDTLRRIYELSERGVGGEKDSAKAKLEALLHKHNLTLAEVLSTKEEPVAFSWRTPWEAKLLVQIIGMVKNTRRFPSWKRGKRKEIIVTLTAAEALDVKRFYAHYRHAFEEQLADFFHAFCQRNDLFADESGESPKPLTPEERARLRRILQMSEMMVATPAPRALLKGKV